MARFLALLMLERCSPMPTTGVMVSAPPSPNGLARRGYDTAGLLVAELSRLMPDLSARPGMLRRSSGGRQLGRDRSERLAAGRDIVATGGIEGPVILVDDVLTTGATLSASARALRGAGATTVEAVTFTRRP